MLNENSQRTLCQILMKYIEGENRVEILRRCLCENYDFSPRVLFRSLCRVYSDSLLPKDFKEFLQSNGEAVTDQETYLLVRQYSSLQNGRMSEEDFSHFVLSATNETLPLLVSKRLHVNDVKAGVKFSFLALIREEIRLHRETEELKVQLFQDPDFSLWKAFEFLNSTCKGFVSEDDITKFLQSRGKFITQNDFDALMRRIDLEDDLVISYNEFLEAFIPLQVPKTTSAFMSKTRNERGGQSSDSQKYLSQKISNSGDFRTQHSPKIQSRDSREEQKTETKHSNKLKEEPTSEDRPLQAHDLDDKQSEDSEKAEKNEKSEDSQRDNQEDENVESHENVENHEKVPDEFSDQEKLDEYQDSQKRQESQEYSEENLDDDEKRLEENESEHFSRDDHPGNSGSEDDES